MIRAFAALLLLLTASAGMAQEVRSASSATLRLLDKTTGELNDVEMGVGEQREWGLLKLVLSDCRYPPGNPSGEAYAQMTVFYRTQPDPVFRGWMVASSPALNPMDHPRYDVWVLRCNT